MNVYEVQIERSCDETPEIVAEVQFVTANHMMDVVKRFMMEFNDDDREVIMIRKAACIAQQIESDDTY